MSPTFTPTTTDDEVAIAFANEIKGKNGRFNFWVDFQPFPHARSNFAFFVL